MNVNLLLSLVSSTGMILVGAAAVVYWRRLTHIQFRWFWVGAGLWIVAVALKLAFSFGVQRPLLLAMMARMAQPLFILTGGLMVGVVSSLFEIGATFLAVRRWSSLGENAERAIGIGVGAGGFEAMLLGVLAFIGMIPALIGAPGSEGVADQLDATAAVTPLFWLVAPVERVLAILVHASSRAMVLLGATLRNGGLVLGGLTIFALLDSVAGIAQLSGQVGMISTWWIEIGLLPMAIMSIPLLHWLYRQWPAVEAETNESPEQA